MAKVPGFARAFAGRWRIVEMDTWDNDVLDIGEEAHLTFEGGSQGEIAFVALKGFLASATARVTATPAPNSRRKAMTTTTKPVAAAGLCSGPQADLSAISSSIKQTIQASSVSGIDSSTAC